MENNREPEKQNAESLIDKESLQKKLIEEAQRIRVRDIEGEYKFDNPDLEHKSKRQRKVSELEVKYKDKPKIAFH